LAKRCFFKFWRLKLIQLWLLLAALHTMLFVIPPFFLESFNDRVNWFAINAIPWWPLYQLGLPVTRHGWLMTPNALGWAWCALVWTGFYYFLARLIISLNRK
jgi:hypothetical protein